MRKRWGLALLATFAFAACAGAPPAPVARARPAKPANVAPAAPIVEPTEPPPPLFRFGTFPEDEHVQLFALRGTPLLRVGARIFSLRAHEAKREPGLEKVLFDAAGKPWWHVLAGAFPGDLYADRVVAGATERDWPGAEVVRVTEGGLRPFGRLERASGVVHRMTVVPDGRVLVTAQQGDDFPSDVVPGLPEDGTFLRPCTFYGEPARFADGTVAVACGDRRGGPDRLLTFRPDAAPTLEEMPGIDGSSYSDLFVSPGGALHASSRHQGGIYARRPSGWVALERGAPGTLAATRDLHLERARPGAHAAVELTLHGRHLEVPASGFAHDPEGGVWALAESGLGLFHDRAPQRLVELAPSRPGAAPITTDLPVPALAARTDPGAPLVEVLDATRHLGDDGGALRIHPLVGRTFVTIDDQILYVDGDALKSDPSLQRGLGDRSSGSWGREVFGAIGGRFPESAWLPVTQLGERGNGVSILHWTGSGWTDTLPAGEQGKADRVHPLANGWSILQSLQGGFAYRYGPGLYLSLLHDDVANKVVGAGLKGLADHGVPRAVATLPDGTLFVAFADAVAAWSADGTPRPVAPLPPGTTPYGLAARSADAIHVMLHPTRAPAPEGASWSEELEAARAEGEAPAQQQRLFRYDGRAWMPETLPAHTARMQQLLLGPHGSLWVTLAESPEVLVRSSSGAWSTMRAPAHLDTIWAGPAGDVWATSGARLFHTRPLPRGFDLATVLPPRGIEQWGGYCGTVAVLVHDVPRTAPRDVSFDATIEVLRPSLGADAGKATYYEITTGGRRALLVQIVPGPESDDLDRAVVSANALLKLAEAKIPGAKPRLVCLRHHEKGALPRGVQSLRAVGGAAVPTSPAK